MASISVEPDGVTVRSRPGETILRALSRSGFGYRIGCRRGGCGICKVDLLAGSVEYEAVVAASVLGEEERARGGCLSCRAVPTDDVVIALRDDKLRCNSKLLAAVAGARSTKSNTQKGPR